MRAKELEFKGANPGADADVHVMPELQDTQRRLEAELAAFKAAELAVPMPPQPSGNKRVFKLNIPPTRPGTRGWSRGHQSKWAGIGLLAGDLGSRVAMPDLAQVSPGDVSGAGIGLGNRVFGRCGNPGTQASCGGIAVAHDKQVVGVRAKLEELAGAIEEWRA